MLTLKLHILSAMNKHLFSCQRLINRLQHNTKVRLGNSASSTNPEPTLKSNAAFRDSYSQLKESFICFDKSLQHYFNTIDDDPYDHSDFAEEMLKDLRAVMYPRVCLSLTTTLVAKITSAPLDNRAVSKEGNLLEHELVKPLKYLANHAKHIENLLAPINLHEVRKLEDTK